MLLTVAVAFPWTNSLSGIYMRRTGPRTQRSRYQSPATLPGLRVELMLPPIVVKGLVVRGLVKGSTGDNARGCQNVSSFERTRIDGMLCFLVHLQFTHS